MICTTDCLKAKQLKFVPIGIFKNPHIFNIANIDHEKLHKVYTGWCESINCVVLLPCLVIIGDFIPTCT